MIPLLLGSLTVLLVLNCIVLVLLVLIQLPKKEAGIGMAFGAGATETLFGAGSGSVLTKITKYAAALFLSLSLLLSVVGAHIHQNKQGALDAELLKRAAAAPAATPAAGSATAPASATPTSATPVLQLTSTNAPAAPAPAPAQQGRSPVRYKPPEARKAPGVFLLQPAAPRQVLSVSPAGSAVSARGYRVIGHQLYTAAARPAEQLLQPQARLTHS